MTALSDWMVLPPGGLSAAEYAALPEEVCRRIEIVDGAIVVTPAPVACTRSSQGVSRTNWSSPPEPSSP